MRNPSLICLLLALVPVLNADTGYIFDLDDRMYAAVLLAVLATTIVTPILLRRRLSGS